MYFIKKNPQLNQNYPEIHGRYTFFKLQSITITNRKFGFALAELFFQISKE